MVEIIIRESTNDDGEIDTKETKYIFLRPEKVDSLTEDKGIIGDILKKKSNGKT